MTNRFYSAIIDYADLRGCWNRQTGKLEVLVSVLACGFKSHFPHQCKGHSIFRVSFIFISRQISKALSSKTVTLESHEIFDFVVEETCVLSRTRQAPGAPVSIGVWVQVPFPAPTIFSEKDIMPANGLTKPLAGICLCKNQKYASVDIF